MAATLDPQLVKLAQRISAGLQRELGTGIDVRRMVAQPVYARDVLLVCQAMKGSELDALAHEYETLAASADTGGLSQPGSLWPESRSGASPSIWPNTWFRGGQRPRK